MKAQPSDEIDARLAIQDVWGVSGADATDTRAAADGVRLIGVAGARGAADEESICAGCGAGNRVCSGCGEERQLERRHEPRGQRQGEHAHECRDPQRVTHRGGAASGNPRAEPAQGQHRGHADQQAADERRRERIEGDHASSLRASAMSAARRSSSSDDRREASVPSSAATASPVEPSKKVCTRWRIAD